MIAKPRCRWRGRRIAWCRKYGRFCDPPREYEYCLGYEPVERLHETLPFAKVQRNITVLRAQIFPAETKGSPSPNPLCPRCGIGPVYEAWFMSSPVVWCWNCGLLFNLETGEVYGENKRTGSWEDYSKNKEIVEGRKSSWVQIPPAMDMLNIYDKHPSYTSMYSMSMSSTLELKNRFGPELKQMISEAEGQKREVGAMLCQTAAGQPHLSRACYGRRETVTVADCHDGLSPLGSFHVHLGGTSIFSPADLELALRKEQLSCLGYTKTGRSYLKCIMPKRYYELPYETQASIKQSLDQARQDIERANQLFRASPSNPEAQSLSQRAQATLRNVESMLQAYEVPL